METAMREILFRAWDTARKEYLSGGEFLLAIQPGKRPEATRTYLDVLDSPDMYKNRFIVEQYTGLTDKNGKRIFDGDICIDVRGFRFVVEWDSDNARFLGRGGDYIRYVGQEPAVVVIGNIHDNQEVSHAG